MKTVVFAIMNIFLLAGDYKLQALSAQMDSSSLAILQTH